MPRNFSLILMASLLACAMVSCPGTESTDETNSGGDTNTGPVTQPAIDPNNPRTKTEKVSVAANVAGVEQNRIYHEVWIGVDTNADPRNAIGYKLVNSDKQFFDNVVIFHSDISWDHLDPDTDAPAEASKRGWCEIPDVHHHQNSNTQWLLEGYDKFIQPLKDAGLQVLICPLPSQGMSYGTIGDWPGGNDEWNNSSDADRDGKWEDIMGAEGAKRWAKSLADFCTEYNLDGIALDDEYAHTGMEDYGLRGDVYAGKYAEAGGLNLLKWLRYFKDYTKDAEHPNGKWVSIYYHNIYATNMPASATFQSVNDTAPREYFLKDAVDAMFPSAYGPFQTSVYKGIEAAQHFPLSIAFDAFPAVTTSVDTIKNQALMALRGNMGGFMYFALRERSFYQTLPFFGPIGTMPETWLSAMAEVLYRDRVYYDGEDHPKFPMQRGIDVWAKNTGAMYKPRAAGEHPDDYASDYF